MELTKLRRDLAQCWLAETLVQVLERAATQCQVEWHVLVSLGDATICAQGKVLSVLLNGFVHQSEVYHTKGSYVHVGDVKELQKWSINQDFPSSAGIMVVYAPCDDEKEVNSYIQEMTHFQLGFMVLIVHNPDGLLGLTVESKAIDSSSMFHLAYMEEKMETQSIRFITEPLKALRDQCGWHFVMEIIQWVLPNSCQVEKTAFGAAQTPMFSSLNQLPFQLVLLVLRWSHFHPELVRVCAKKLRRQMQLLPQIRIRHQLAELETREMKLWHNLYPSEKLTPLTPSTRQKPSASALFTDTSSQIASSKLEKLSNCCLWDTQKQFYKDQGIRAWSSGAIPFGVSSSSFLAAAYARITVDFLLSNAACIKPSCAGNGPNCFVWEAASGSCKFLHAFLLHFTELVTANEEFKRRGLVPLVVATDLSAQVLDSRRQMECFHPFLERGQLDFALFDTQDFVHGDSAQRKTLQLVHAQRQWIVGSDGPVALVGNYFLDSLRADIFTVAVQQTEPSDKVPVENVVIQAVLLDKDTSSIKDMDVSLEPVPDPRIQAVYEDSRLNETLIQVLDHFQPSTVELVSSTGLILFPVEAFEFFLTLIDTTTFPVAILAGDTRFSFRDAISSAFLTTKGEGTCYEELKFRGQVSLELPQLSPHPDCFCLPVDFEIFQLFFQHLNSTPAISANAKVVKAPASDTFDLFLATIEPQTQISAKNPISNTRLSFQHQFARFTPGDCDLLWGMISIDDGARCFSMDSLLALLTQTCWDFDLFTACHWELLNRLRQEADSFSEKYQQLVVTVGIKSWRTFYNMEQSEKDVTTRTARLELARWFYELEAYDAVLDVLTPWRDEASQDMSLADIGVFYLLGLTSLKRDENWTALSFFRLCVRLAPTKLKFQRQVARTLLALQTVRSSSNSSKDSKE